MKKLHLLLLPAAVLALVFGLVACGGSDESDEDKVAETIETAVFSTNPDDCTKYATQAFLEQSQFEEGAAAVKGCEEDAGDTEDDPDSVSVSKVEVDGSKATANAAFVGGVFDGQTVTIALVEEDGNWKLDELVEFAKFDQERIVKAFEEGVTRGDEALPKTLASCIGDVFRGLSQSEFEDVFIGGNPESLVEVVESCQQPQQ